MNIEDINQASSQIEAELEAKIEALRIKICEEILLPFCKKHQLVLKLNPYGDRFYDTKWIEPDEDDEWDEIDELGGEYHTWDLVKVFGEEGAMIEKVLATQVARYDIFDQCDIKFDITEEDIR